MDWGENMSDERCPHCLELDAQIGHLHKVEGKLRDENYQLKNKLAQIEDIAHNR